MILPTCVVSNEYWAAAADQLNMSTYTGLFRLGKYIGDSYRRHYEEEKITSECHVIRKECLEKFKK